MASGVVAEVNPRDDNMTIYRGKIFALSGKLNWSNGVLMCLGTMPSGHGKLGYSKEKRREEKRENII